MTTVPLHAQFDIIRLRLHLRQHPQDSHRLAIEHFQDYLEVVHRYKKLEKKLKAPSLPPIPTQRNYPNLATKKSATAKAVTASLKTP